MSVTTYSSEQIVKALFSTSTLTRPTAWNVSLHTADPGRTGANEVADANYARQSVTFTVQQNGNLWQAITAAAVSFPGANAQFTVTHVGVFDAATGGNPVFTTEIPLARTVEAGGVFTVPAGELIIDGGLV